MIAPAELARSRLGRNSFDAAGSHPQGKLGGVLTGAAGGLREGKGEKGSGHARELRYRFAHLPVLRVRSLCLLNTPVNRSNIPNTLKESFRSDLIRWPEPPPFEGGIYIQHAQKQRIPTDQDPAPTKPRGVGKRMWITKPRLLKSPVPRRANRFGKLRIVGKHYRSFARMTLHTSGFRFRVGCFTPL